MQYQETMHDLLNQLEQTLKTIGWWQNESPPEHALRSQEPFCIDTLSFTEWLQWIYLPKIRLYLQSGQKLPGKSRLFPIAEEAWKNCGENTAGLLTIIQALDNTSNQQMQ